jgi:hypothetical protein
MRFSPSYSIFDKDLDELTAADLVRLREVPEGWFVEYKRQFPGLSSAAKSLSAFANSYGGWLFYGVREKGDGSRTAGEFPGIPAADVPNVEQWLQQAASQQVAPSPFYTHRVLRGPVDEIGLLSDHAIIAIHVPIGQNSPYIHSSGRIYRRVADASDPTVETDRHFLDLLWERGRETRRKFANLIESKPELSEGESGTTFLRVWFFPDPWGEKGIRSTLTFKDFSELMRDESPGGIPFDNIFVSSDAFIARQVKGSTNPLGQALTWRYYENGTSEVVLPFSSSPANSSLFSFLRGYEQQQQFINLCNSQRLRSAIVIDLSLLYVALTAIAGRVRNLLKLDGLRYPLFFKSQVIGAWRRVPFLDTPEFISFAAECGLPVIQQSHAIAPEGLGPETCVELRDYSGDGPDSALINGAITLFHVGAALGLPTRVFGYSAEADNPEWLTRCHAMGDRAREVSLNRMSSETP